MIPAPDVTGGLLAGTVLVAWPAPVNPRRRARFPGHKDGVESRVVPPAVAIGFAMVLLWLALGDAGPLLTIVVAGAAVARRRFRRAQGSASPADAALFAELLAGGLEAGATPPAAVRLAGAALGDRIGSVAGEVAAALLAGLPAAEAWTVVAADPILAPVATVVCRSAQTGAPVAGELKRIARRIREQRKGTIQRRASRAGVWLVLPLGTCFLPAFALLTVVPVVVGLLPGSR